MSVTDFYCHYFIVSDFRSVAIFLKKRKNVSSTLLLELDSGINEGITQIGDDEAGDIEEGTDIGHGADDGVISGVDGFDGEVSQAGDAEETFQKKRTEEKERDGQDDLGNDGDHGIFEDVLKEDPGSGCPFCASGTDIIGVDFVEDDGAVETDGAAQAADDADNDGEGDIFNRTQAGFIPEDGKKSPLIGKEILPN